MEDNNTSVENIIKIKPLPEKKERKNNLKEEPVEEEVKEEPMEVKEKEEPVKEEEEKKETQKTKKKVKKYKKKVKTPEEIEENNRRKLEALERGRKTVIKNRIKDKAKLKMLEENNISNLNVDELTEKISAKVIQNILDRFEKLDNNKRIPKEFKKFIPKNHEIAEEFIYNKKLQKEIEEDDPNLAFYLNYKKNNFF